MAEEASDKHPEEVTDSTSQSKEIAEAKFDPNDMELPDVASEPVPPVKAQKQNRFKRLLSRYWAKKKLTLPLTVLALLGLLLLVPATRYPLLGIFIKKDFTVQVLDQTSNKPVSKAQVQLGNAVAQTDAQGKVKLHVPVGTAQLEVTKKYFKTNSLSVLVPLKQKSVPFKVSVQATGRQVPVTVTNKITGKPIANALLAAAGTEAKTDKDGKVVIVLPAGKKTVDVTVGGQGYNNITGKLQVTEQAVPENSFQLVSTGKVYFLSKLSGKIDVVKTNLDGSERQTVLAGTGKESGTDTILLASTDWKYLALKSTRDGGTNPKLFLIDTSNDKLATMDEGNAGFTAVGWSDHRFVYLVYRNGYQIWQPKAQALKSYDAAASKLTTIDETDGEGSNTYDYVNSQFNSIYILNNELVYSKAWSGSYYGPSKLNGKQVSLTSVKPDGSAKKSVKDFPIPDGRSYFSLQLRLYSAKEVYVQAPGTDKSAYYEYEDGKVTAKTDLTDQQFNDPYPTYLASPSGKLAFWSDERDGKNVLFVGDASGDNGKQIASLSEYTPYGWYTDDYLLVSKNSSELYIMPAGGGTPLKMTDYHKPDYNFRGYGGGYGGF